MAAWATNVQSARSIGEPLQVQVERRRVSSPFVVEPVKEKQLVVKARDITPPQSVASWHLITSRACDVATVQPSLITKRDRRSTTSWYVPPVRRLTDLGRGTPRSAIGNGRLRRCITRV